MMDKPTAGHRYRVWFTNAIPPREVTVADAWTGAEVAAGRWELSHELATRVFFSAAEGGVYAEGNIERLEDLGPAINRAEVLERAAQARAVTAHLMRMVEEAD
jgi:hypothetical protein